METSDHDQRLHVVLEYVRPDSNGKIHKVEFYATQNEVRDQVRRVIERVSMDTEYQRKLLAKLDQDQPINMGVLFLEPSPGRRVCLVINYYNDRIKDVKPFGDLQLQFA